MIVPGGLQFWHHMGESQLQRYPVALLDSLGNGAASQAAEWASGEWAHALGLYKFRHVRQLLFCSNCTTAAGAGSLWAGWVEVNASWNAGLLVRLLSVHRLHWARGAWTAMPCSAHQGSSPSAFLQFLCTL